MRPARTGFLIGSCKKKTQASRDLTELPSDVRNQAVSPDDSQREGSKSGFNFKDI